jgi:hypothetical protein
VEEVMCNTAQCRPAITGCPQKLEKALARINIPEINLPNPDTGKLDKYATRTSIAMVLGWRKVQDDFGDCEVWEKDWQQDEEGQFNKFGVPQHKRALAGGVL